MTELLVGPVLRHVGERHATVWVETDGPCTVEVAGCSARTFTVSGHHYALVVVTGLEPGTVTEYDVRLDGARVWPQPDGRFPPSRIRTLGHDGPVRVSFGSCRYATPRALGTAGGFGPDALDTLAHRLARTPDRDWPDLLLLLGDQVYADETTAEIRARIRQRRGDDTEPRGEVRDFEEYTWLYLESWRDVEVRWLLSTVPSAMIFDDHDVHDDWNTSGAWRRDAAAQPWWPERVLAGLASYWVYQHLGNLSPAELDADPTWRAVRELPPGEDAEPLLRELARRADAEADGAKGYRWSYRRDLGGTRVVVIDSRCGRLLDGDRRSMLGDAEWQWLADQLVCGEDGPDHVLVGTSLPWLLAPALHDLEAWDERLAADPRPRRAAAGEKLRRAADLEHWAAFGESFERLSDLLRALARGERGGTVPASVSVLSGDVHHSYVCRARWPGDGTAAAGPAAPVHQVTCSPLHNRLPGQFRAGFRVAWSAAAQRVVRAFVRRAGVPAPDLRWDRVGGPWFGNMLATLVLEGRRAQLTLEVTSDRGEPLRPRATVDLTEGAPAARVGGAAGAPS